MFPEKEPTGEKKDMGEFDHFEYDRLVCIDFNSVRTEYICYNIRYEMLQEAYNWEHNSFPSVCFYSGTEDNYDNATFVEWEEEVDEEMGSDKLCVDDLRDKVEYLFSIESDATKPLPTAKERFYQRAIVRYFREVIKQIEIDSDLSKNRYVMTYPSDWNMEQVMYLRSLVRLAGIVDEQDHSQRLLMYSEGESILRYLQEPYICDLNIRQDHNYLICDLGDTKVKMDLFKTKTRTEGRNDIKSVNRIEWETSFEKNSPKLNIGGQNLFERLEEYVLSRLLISLKMHTLEEVLKEDISSFKQSYDFEVLMDDVYEKISIMDFTRETSVQNAPFHFAIPTFFQLKGCEQSRKESTLDLHPREIEKNVLGPVCDQILWYIGETLREAGDSVDAIIFVGCFSNCEYLKDLITYACKGRGIQFYFSREQNGSDISNREMVFGAILKGMDLKKASDPKPKIVFGNGNSSMIDSQRKERQNVLVFIDFGFIKTNVSYILPQAKQNIESANINYIMDWPGQCMPDINFPTLDVMIVPSSKNIISLTEYADHRMQFLKLTQGKQAIYEYFTFEKDQYGITLVTHCGKKIERKLKQNVNDLLIAQHQHLNSTVFDNNKEIDGMKISNTSSYPGQTDTFFPQTLENEYEISTTRKRISVQEFALIYFEYFTQYLSNYFHSKTGRRKNRFRFCITRDSQAYSDEFKLSDEDIYEIGYKCSMISVKSHNNLQVLERAEATAIYCRNKVDTSIAKETEAFLHFLQVHLYPDRCVLLLNDVPLPSDDNVSRENGEPIKYIYKYAKTKNTSINIMDVISENLWMHIQKCQLTLLEKCGMHKFQRSYFNSKNMRIFKDYIHSFLSKNKIGIKNGEKVHTISIGNSCCRLRIANMDLLEFGIIPAINQLVSIIQGSISDQGLFQGVEFKDVFIMGEFIDCRDGESYKFMEDLMLSKIRKIKFRPLDNFILQSHRNDVQVTKLREEKLHQVQIGNNSTASISLSGSVIYGLNDGTSPLVERIANRSYAIYVNHLSKNAFVNSNDNFCVNFDDDDASSDELIPIIRKHFPLPSITTAEGGEIEKLFTLINCSPNQVIKIGLYTSLSEKESSWNMDSEDSKLEEIKIFAIKNHPTYPVKFKSQISQTDSYKFWVEHGINEVTPAIHIRENVFLKSV